MTDHAPDQMYCSDLSLQAGEPLPASAPQAQAYLLLEYNGAWGEKALEESDIPAPVIANLNELGAQVKGLKTLLIKTQPAKRQPEGIHFYVAALSARPPRLYAFILADYHGVLSLDVPAILAGLPAYDPHLAKTPLYLVCANGRRDRCCARHGLPVYNALAEALPSDPQPQVWQCTHLGGHRFAANLVCLPHGLAFGRVRAESALEIIEAYRDGRIYLPNLRGRVCDRPVVQAAEYFLHQHRSGDGIDDYHPLDAQEIEPGAWQVRISDTRSEQVIQLRVHVTPTEQRVFESCALEKSTSILKYDFELE
jgi:hypothetical protein